jgi:hypothetical protein
VTDTQLYLAIGVPMLFNLALYTLSSNNINKRFDHMNKRFDDMRDLWRSELRRWRKFSTHA